MNRDDAKNQVLQAVDIVRLIDEQLPLKKKGKDYVGLCPFHDDSKPSMHVSEQKQIYKCFACGAGGDAFSFMMNYHKMTFPEALQSLADRVGIALPRRSAGQIEQQSARQTVGQANEHALVFYQQMLHDEQLGEAARAYLKQRGISRQMIEDFKIGYAPAGWDHLVGHIRDRRWDQDSFAQADLILARQDGSGYYDRFRHRLMFPILDAMGRCIAFGGRRINEQDEPKYLNSSQTPLFDKSSTLYGMHLAKQAIMHQADRTAVIVEGYTDVIAAHQAGQANVLATLGTALTRAHARELKRYTERVVLLFDADEAGLKAAERGLEIFFNEPIDVTIAVLPGGQDPAEVLAGPEGRSVWEQTLDSAQDALQFHFTRIQHQFEQTASLSGRQRLVESYMQHLAQLGFAGLSPTRRALVCAQLADMLHMDMQTVRQLIAQARRPAPRQVHDESVIEEPGMDELIEPMVADSPAGRRIAERGVVGILLARPEYFHEPMPDGRPLCESVMPYDLADGKLQAVYGLLHDYLSDHTPQAGLRVSLRDIYDHPGMFDLAVALQFEIDVDDPALSARLAGYAAAIADWNARSQYMRDKQDQTATEQSPDEYDRLLHALQFRGEHGALGRFGRVERI